MTPEKNNQQLNTKKEAPEKSFFFGTLKKIQEKNVYTRQWQRRMMNMRLDIETATNSEWEE